MKNWLFPAVLSTVSVGFFPSTAQASTFYTFSTSQPCTRDCVGNIDVMGTIETDGTLGAITTANIVDWELVFNSSNYSNTILSPNNGEIRNNAANLIATETEITFEVFGSSDPDGSSFFFETTLSFPFSLIYGFQGGFSTPSLLTISNAPASTIFDPRDRSQTTIFDGEGGTVVLATRQAEPVPEPATILGVVTAMGLGSSFKRKLAKKKAA